MTLQPSDVTAGGFEAYVAARGPSLVRFAILLTGSEHRAEDIVQEALARAYIRWSQIRRADDPEVYVRRLIINGSRSWWRRLSNRELPSRGGWETGDTYEIGEARGDPGEAVAERDELWRHVAGLPYRQRAVVVLRYYEDLDDAAIAQILNCSQVTVRTHAMRGLRRLRDRLEEGRR